MHWGTTLRLLGEKTWSTYMTDRAKPKAHVGDHDSQYGGLQLLPEYKKKLDPKFLEYYFKNFVNDRMIYGHWSAGPRGVNFTDYHRMVMVRDGNTVSQINENCNVDMHAHTFGRNRNSCAVAIAGFMHATTSDLGDNYATPGQLKRFVKDVSEICCNLRIPIGNFMSHAEAADNIDQGEDPPYNTPGMTGPDAAPYGPLSGAWERWDLHVLINKKTLALTPPFGHAHLPAEEGSIPLTDWVRGEAILNIQDMTYKYWGK